MSLEWDPIQRAAWEACNPMPAFVYRQERDRWEQLEQAAEQLRQALNGEQSETSEEPTLTWTLENGFVVHIDGHDIPIIIDLETWTVRPA